MNIDFGFLCLVLWKCGLFILPPIIITTLMVWILKKWGVDL